MNIIMTGSKEFVEIQGTGEGYAFSKEQLDTLITLAEKGIEKIIQIENKEKLTERIKKVIEVIEKLLKENIKVSVSNLISSIDDEQLTNLISNLSIEEEVPFTDEKKRRVFDDCLRRVKEMALREKLKKMKREIATRGKEYSEKELEKIQTILYQLKRGR